MNEKQTGVFLYFSHFLQQKSIRYIFKYILILEYILSEHIQKYSEMSCENLKNNLCFIKLPDEEVSTFALSPYLPGYAFLTC